MTDNDEQHVKLAALRRVRTAAGALKFNRAIGQVINEDVKDDSSISRSVTLTRLLSIYNRMRAAKLYGQEADFRVASRDMAEAINDYAQKAPGGAKRLRDIVEKLSFADEEARRRSAIAKAKTDKD